MPTPTYDLIATTTLSSSPTSFTWSSIPNTYRDIVLVADFSPSTTTTLGAQFNDDTTNNYSSTTLYGDSSTVSSLDQNSTSTIRFGSVNNRCLAIAYVLDYQTSKNKTLIGRFNSDNESGATVGMRYSTEVITSVTFRTTGGATFASGDIFSIYGVVSS